MHLKVKSVLFFKRAAIHFRTLKASLLLTNCRDLNAFISVYDLFTNTYEEIISNRGQVLNETEAANIEIPFWSKSSTFKGGLYCPVSLS